MQRKLVLVGVFLISFAPVVCTADAQLFLTISPIHIHQTMHEHLSGWLGFGIGVEYNKKWAASLSWETDQSVFMTMETPVRDTNRFIDVFAVELTRVFRLPQRESTDIRVGFNVGIGTETTTTYEYADGAVEYYDRLNSQEEKGRTHENRAMAGATLGMTTKWLGTSVGVQYRPKVYGIGNENRLVHSGEINFRIRIGSL